MRTRRARRCDGCWLPEASCVCAELPRIDLRTRVVLIMHSVEARRSSNTGRLAAQALGAEVRLRGRKDPAPRAPLPHGRRLLLFPAYGARALCAQDAGPEPAILIVPDGNWKQASRVLHRDEDARDAEVVTLPPGPASRYFLRKGPSPAALCTLEAIARALGILESPAVEAALMRALDLFVARTLALRGDGVLPSP